MSGRPFIDQRSNLGIDHNQEELNRSTSSSTYDNSDQETIRFTSEPYAVDSSTEEDSKTLNGDQRPSPSSSTSSFITRSPPTTLIQPIPVCGSTTNGLLDLNRAIVEQTTTQAQSEDQKTSDTGLQNQLRSSPTLRRLSIGPSDGNSPGQSEQPPQPQNFLSGASKRLPELQHHLNLNPDSSSPKPSYQPSESDPLLSHSSHYPLPSVKQDSGPGCKTCLAEALNPNLSNRSSLFSSTRPHPPSGTRSSRILNTFDGVFLPTVLSILNALYFMRFGYCIGRIGLLGTLSLLLLAYLIIILTVFSLSAIATNGQVRGGGAYYLISRTLGPEFGGSIGILFCLSQALTAAMNIIGFVEAFQDISHLGLHPDRASSAPTGSGILPSTLALERYTMRSVVLLAATIGCILLGLNKIFFGLARSITMTLVISLLSIYLSFLTKRPFSDDSLQMRYTSFSAETFKQNLYPTYLTWLGDPGRTIVVKPKFSDYQKVFGILFSSLSGILAGSSLSGELRKPSKSIPLGMSLALICIAAVYLFTLLGLSASISRDGFTFSNQDGLLNLVTYQISDYPIVLGFGILLCTLFSSLIGISACGKTLQAVSRDGLLPVLKPFFSQGSRIGDDPLYSIMFCYTICQLAIIYNVNQIAVHISTISLLVFVCINLACFTLRISGSPNFRPSFRLFSEWTALFGLFLAFVSMYLVDPVSASTCLIVMIAIFVAIHYSSPAKQWGEVTQSIIYHQVRKYLLRLDERKDNVKYWRPQIMLFTNDPRHDWNQIVFCNSLKKGGLYVLAHIIKSEFSTESIKELQDQQLNWLGLVDISKIKAFVDITLAPDERLGARQLLLTAGLGGMRPNICILGFPTNLKWRGKGRLVEYEDGLKRGKKGNPNSSTRSRRRSDSSMTVKGMIIESTSEVAIDLLGSLPTDSQRSETPIKPVDFVGIIEDSLSLNKSVGLTYGFQGLRLPDSISKPQSERPQEGVGGTGVGENSGAGGVPNTVNNQNLRDSEKNQGARKKRWIDLWPILREGESAWETYTMVLQLGTVLSLVPTWRKNHDLRVTIFCEHESEISEERRRMEKLLSDLRIRATLRVCVLGNGKIESYQCLVKGKVIDLSAWKKLENLLAGDPWWETLKFMRAQDCPPELNGDSSRKKSKSSNSSPLSANFSDRNLDKALLTKNSQTNNIRIKALHPLSRRGSQQAPKGSHSDSSQAGDNEGEDDEELVFEENDGDDDTVARAAYSRNKKGSVPFVGLPDEPQLRIGSTTTAHQIQINDYGSTLHHQSLDLQNLTLSLPDQHETRPNNFFHNKRGPSTRSVSSSSASSTSSSSLRGESSDNGKNSLSPSFFKKVALRRKSTRGISATLNNRKSGNGAEGNPLLGKFRDDFRDRSRTPSNSSECSTNNFQAGNRSNSSRRNSNSHGYSKKNSIHGSSDPKNVGGNNHENNNGEGGNSNSKGQTAELPAIELDFNSLPMRAQLICLNELIKFNSDEEETAIIFTSLPPPESGSSNTYEGSLRYLDQLESFLEGLPPVLAIYAKQFTVTASL